MSDTSTPLPTAGWYSDPQNNSQLRYWDSSQWTDHVRPVITEQAPGSVAAQPVQQPTPTILVVTTNDVPGYQITNVAGEVCGLAVRARTAFTNMGASYRTMSGGEVAGYARLLVDSRREAVDRLKVETAAVGANAVVALRYDSGEIADLLNEVAAYGTAVTVEPI